MPSKNLTQTYRFRSSHHSFAETLNLSTNTHSKYMLVIEHQIRIYIIIKNNYTMIMLIILINSMIVNVHPHLLYHTQPIDSHIMLYDSIGCIMLYPWFRAYIPNPENVLSGCLTYTYGTSSSLFSRAKIIDKNICFYGPSIP